MSDISNAPETGALGAEGAVVNTIGGSNTGSNDTTSSSREQIENTIDAAIRQLDAKVSWGKRDLIALVAEHWGVDKKVAREAIGNAQSDLRKRTPVSAEDAAILLKVLSQKLKSPAPFDPPVLLMPSVSLPGAFKVGALTQAINSIREKPDWEKMVSDVRALPEDKYKEGKEALPALVFNGSFGPPVSNATFRVSSGLFHFDIDKLKPEQLPAIKAALAGIPSLVFAFISPSGKGLKAALRINPGIVQSDADFKRVYVAGEMYVNSVLQPFKATIDPNCKNVSRLCFISHDPDAYRNERPDVWKPELPKIEAERPKASGHEYKGDEVLQARCVKIITTGLMKSEPGGRHAARVKFARMAGGLVASGECQHEVMWEALLDASGAISDGGRTPDKELQALDDMFKAGLESPYSVAEPDSAAAFEAAEALGVPVTKGTSYMPTDYLDYVDSAISVFTPLAKKKAAFIRGGGVVEVKKSGLSDMSDKKLMSVIDKYTKPMRHKKFGQDIVAVPTRCRIGEAQVLLASAEAEEILSPITRVSVHPTLSQSGEILTKGYHNLDGGIYVLKGSTVPDVPLFTAVDDLLETLVDFDFVSEGDKVRALAAYLSPAMAMAGFFPYPPPIDFRECNDTQGGKGYGHACVRAVYGEKGSMIGQKKGGVGSIDESFASALLRGGRFIVWDNFRGKIDSPLFEMMLTCEEEMPVRVPHRGEVQVDVRSVTNQLSSNGVEGTRDLANRASIIRIIKHAPEYQYKVWEDGKDTLDHIRANQLHYLGCVFAIVKEWVRQGKQGTKCDHDRKRWAEPLNWIMKDIFGMCDLMTDHAEAKSRLSESGAIWLRAIGLKLQQNGRLGEALSTSDLVEFSNDEGIEIPGLQWSADVTKMARRVGAIMQKTYAMGAVTKIPVLYKSDKDRLKVDRIYVDRAHDSELFRYETGNSKTMRVYKYTFLPVSPFV